MNLFADRRARRAREAELAEVRAAIESACAAMDESAADGLRVRLAQLAGGSDEAALEVEMLDGLRDAAAFARAAERAGLPAIETQHRVLAGERCRLAVPVSTPDGADGATGKLFFTDARAVFLSSAVTAIPWSGVARVDREARDLLLATGAGRRYRFRCNSFADALRGAWLAARLAASR
jgi:hypothetical protein